MILDESFPPDARVENEASSLINTGHDVYLFCLNFSDKLLLKEEEFNRINIMRFKLSKITKKLSALAYTFPLYHLIIKTKIKLFLKSNEIEVIHVHDIRVARSIFMLNKRLPVILDLHENRPEIMKYYSWVNSGLGKLLVNPKRWAKFESRYIKKADKTIVVTEEAKKFYTDKLKIDQQKIVVVPNTVRSEFYSNFTVEKALIEKYKNNFSLLYVGETGFRRGLITVLNSLKYLIEEIPEIKLIIVGKSKDDNILKKIAEENSLNEFVDFEGWKDFSLFQSYIKICHIGISPIHRNIHHDTTYANKIFQYMSLGKPIIVSDCPPQADIINKFKCGLVFESENELHFANQVLKIYRDKDFAYELGKNAEKAISDVLNWDIQSEELIEVYKTILEHDNKK